MSAIGNFIKSNIIKPLENAAASIAKTIGKGLEALSKAAQGDWKGACASMLEACKNVLETAGAVSDLVPGLKFSPLGQLKGLASKALETGLEMSADLVKTGGANLAKIGEKAVKDTLSSIPAFSLAESAVNHARAQA